MIGRGRTARTLTASLAVSLLITVEATAETTDFRARQHAFGS